MWVVANGIRPAPDVVEDRGPPARPQHGDQVDAHLLRTEAVLLGPAPGQPVQPLEPDRVDRLVG